MSPSDYYRCEVVRSCCPKSGAVTRLGAGSGRGADSRDVSEVERLLAAYGGAREEQPRRTPRFSARELNSCVIARTAITEHHSFGPWSERNVFSHASVGWKSRIQVSTALVFPAASLLPLYLVAFLLCPHVVLSLCVRVYCLMCLLKKIIYLFLTVLGLHCCTGFSLVAVTRGTSCCSAWLLTAVASLVELRP